MNSVTSGSLAASGQVQALGTRGVLTYAQCITGTLSVFDGNGSGVLLCTLAAGEQYSPSVPVQFKNGLYATIGTGPSVIHTG